MTDTPRREWVAYFELKVKDGVRRRYLQMPGAPKYRGMYRNRRLRGYDPATWTDDVSLAARFRSPSEAKRSRWTFAPAKVERMKFEKITS